jgi:transposase
MAKRIFERLRIEHGFAGGYTVVKDYARLARTRVREVFVPLAHPPGHAQVDFGECVGVIGGVRMRLQVFCFDLPQSDACFIKAYPALRSSAARLACTASNKSRARIGSCSPRCASPR